MAKSAQFWLVKSEPDSYSIDDLKRDKKIAWEGVRNFQARNHMRDMNSGDSVLFYHSGTQSKSVVGIARVCAAAHADESQFQTDGEYFDKRATREKPVWECVDIEFVEKAAQPLTLREMKTDAQLQGLMLLQRGSRLSVQPVAAHHFAHMHALLK